MNSRTAQALACVSLLLVLATYPLLLVGVDRALASMKNAPILWIPDTFPAVQVFRKFVDRFDSLEVILVSWDGATVDDPRLEQVANELRSRQDARSGPKSYSGIANGYTQLRDMMQPPLDLSRAAALRRLQGSMVGPDQQKSCVLVFLTEHGAVQRGDTIDEIADCANDAAGFQQDQLYIAGTTIDGEAIDTLSRESLEKFAIPSTIISFLLCWICLRSLWFAVPVLLIAAYGQSLCLALVYFSGGDMNAVLIVLPTLVFVLSISAGIHLTNYFMEEIRCGQRGEAVNRAISRAWRPSLLAAVTTVIGLMSLLVSDVEPVRQFGWLGASGILTCFALLFLIMPGVMHRWLAIYGHLDTNAAIVATNEEHATPFWQACARVMSRLHSPVAFGGIALLIASGWGLQYLSTSVDVMALLDDDVRVVRDSAWFQQNIGPLVPVEVIVRFPNDSEIDVIDRVKLISEVHAELHSVELLGGVVSVATFVPPIPRQSGMRATVGRSMLRNRIEAEKQSLIDSGYLRVDEEGEHWRVGARAPGHSDVDYVEFLEVLKSRVEPVVERFEADHKVSLQTTYTGATSAVFEVQRALLADLFNSFLTAMVLVGGVMIIAFRRITAGLLAMVPNIFPTFIMFGALGWLDRAVDIGSVMTASVALGIAVDGTFHYLASFRRELAMGHSSLQAVANAYQHCGRALLQTTLVCALGMVIYCFSSFLPARYFTYTFILLLFIAAAGDLILLPALLLGPAARLFTRKTAVVGQS
jgi:predicted RND superfamily exporter protein